MLFNGEQSISELAGKEIWSVGYAAELVDEVQFGEYVSNHQMMMHFHQRITIDPVKFPIYQLVFFSTREMSLSWEVFG